MKLTIFDQLRYHVVPRVKSLKRRSRRGFTLTEIMIGSLLLSVVILIAWTGLLSAMNMSASAQAKTAHKIELTTALDMMTNEVRHAQSVNRSGEVALDGSSVSLADVVTNAGINLDDLGNYGDLALYLELPVDPSITACPSGTPPDSVDRVVYDIRDAPSEWLQPKAVTRYGRIPNIDGKINPCSRPVANDIIADALSSEKSNTPPPCAGVLSGSNGFQSCTNGENVELMFKSVISDTGAKPVSSAITPRIVSFDPIAQETQSVSDIILDLWSSPPPNTGANLFWSWTVDGEALSKETDSAEGYYVEDIDWMVVETNNPDNVFYSTTLVERFGIDMKAYSESNLVGFGHALPQMEAPYLTTCFVAHGKTPSGKIIDSNKHCTTVTSDGNWIIDLINAVI